VEFETFSVGQFLNGWRKSVPSRRPSEGEATLAEFQPCSWLLVAEAAGKGYVTRFQILPLIIYFNWWSYALQISYAVWYRGVLVHA